ncbi:uncharacterized protein EI90DRAFT_1231776 [Cantharellus anzutake]|uniref:uncharacterized protein n=1 Tax=Cantharellus anzutake TaxID=1750568 RepID=UPI0019056D19|nr:uncharacterized protein EI90DRAFT_1231776 [Cantharellus anzutake]KAF8330191.1 hypothetical protein EI90DRAFT_1231776 [Cantharellus anzutake]
MCFILMHRRGPPRWPRVMPRVGLDARFLIQAGSLLGSSGMQILIALERVVVVLVEFQVNFRHPGRDLRLWFQPCSCVCYPNIQTSSVGIRVCLEPICIYTTPTLYSRTLPVFRSFPFLSSSLCRFNFLSPLLCSVFLSFPPLVLSALRCFPFVSTLF